MCREALIVLVIFLVRVIFNISFFIDKLSAIGYNIGRAKTDNKFLPFAPSNFFGRRNSYLVSRKENRNQEPEVRIQKSGENGNE